MSVELRSRPSYVVFAWLVRRFALPSLGREEKNFVVTGNCYKQLLFCFPLFNCQGASSQMDWPFLNHYLSSIVHHHKGNSMKHTTTL